MAVPAARLVLAGTAQGGEVHRHALLHPAHIGFRHVGPDRHRRQIGNPQDIGRLVGGIERLPFTGLDRHHGPGHRGVDARIAQAGFVGLQCGLRLRDLGLQVLDACRRARQLGLGRLHILFARRAVPGHLLLAVPLLLGQPVLGLLLGQLCAQTCQRGPPGIHGGALHAGIDLDQQGALFHRGARGHQQARDLPRHLRPDIHITARLQGANCRHRGLHIAAHRRLRLVRRAGPAGRPQHAPSAPHNHQGRHGPTLHSTKLHQSGTFKKN